MISKYSSLILAIVSIAFGQPETPCDLYPTIELYAQQIDVGGTAITYTAQGVGDAMWNELFNLTDSAAYWDPSGVVIQGFDTSYNHGWDFVGSDWYQRPTLAQDSTG